MAQSPPSNTSGALDNGPSLFETNADWFDPSVRWDYAETDETLWNASFPYQLVVLDVNKDGGSGTPQYSVHERLIFTLPVNPETMTKSMPFAINVAATQGGVVEQHGGAPFRQIQFAGTFGVVSDRPSAGDLQSGRLGGAAGVAAGIAAGTVQAIRNAQTSAASLGAGQKYIANLSPEAPGDADGDIPTGSTGYYQFLALQRFLESYAEAKKRSTGTDLRLGLFIWKEQAAYICTPLAFDVTRTAQSPFEYRYALRLQAWRRVNPNAILMAPSSGSGLKFEARSSYSLARVHALVSNAIRTARSATNVLNAVRRDTAKVFDTFRQVALFAAAVGGIVKTALALPAAIRQDFESAVRESWDILKGSFNNLDPAVKLTVDTIDVEVKALRSAAASAASKTSPALRAALADDEGADFHLLVRPDALNLSPQARASLNDYVDATLSLTSADFRRMADTAFGVAADFADLVGLNDPTYDRVVGRRAKAKLRDATMDDYRALHALGSAAMAIQSLTVNAPSRQPITTIEYVAGLATANGIRMRVPNSKFAVPFPYGSSLERLAQQYLGDATRWMEIAELNDLRAPYIDEAGVVQALATNASGNTLTLVDASALYLGQSVRLWSDVVLPEKRRVVAIRKLSAVQWQVTLDGANDLSKFKTADHASVQWFAVGTVNSQQVIYIPSDGAANPDILKYVPTEKDFDQVLSIGDVDGMLTESGDLVVTLDGDWPFVIGYAAAIQWARTALNTRLNSLALHPGVGLDAGVGESLADSSASDILKSVQSTFRFNPTFSGVRSAVIVRDGPTTKVGLELGLRGVAALLPLTFDVKS